MKAILNLFSEHGVGIIIISWVVVLVLLVWNCFALYEKKKRIEELMETKNKNYKVNKDSHELEEETDESAAITPDTVRFHENKFNELSSFHGAIAQAIPIFPMLGILGTVSGLMLQVQAGSVDLMMASLDTALATTFWGLTAAIILKLADIVPSKFINDVEIMLDNFDRKLELAEMYEKKQNVQTGRRK